MHELEALSYRHVKIRSIWEQFRIFRHTKGIRIPLVWRSFLIMAYLCHAMVSTEFIGRYRTKSGFADVILRLHSSRGAIRGVS
jgi:hypothetical protein